MGSINPAKSAPSTVPAAPPAAAVSATGPGNGSDTSSPMKSARRKQWILHDGPHGSLQRLRLRMAEEGCGHSQVALAKQFLAEKSCEADQMAVHWLVKAADQGHHEGLELLKDCFDGNRGVTEHTYPRVRSLLDMSVQERAARTAAKNLFVSMARGGDFVTARQLEEQLIERLRERLGTKDQVESDGPESLGLSVVGRGGALISEQHLMQAASVYATGRFPPLLRMVEPRPRHRLDCLYRWLVGSIVGRPPPLHLVLALVLFYTALNSPLQALLDLQPATFVALVGWSLALAATVVFTAHACRLVTDWNLFRCWSALLSRHTPQLLPAVPEYIYLSRTFPTSFGRLLMAALPCVSLQPTLSVVRASLAAQSELRLPYGELGVMASLLCSACWPSWRYVWTLTIDDVLCLFGWILLRLEHLPWIEELWASDDGGGGGGDDDVDVDDDDGTEAVLRHERWQLHPALLVRFHAAALVALLILAPLYVRRALRCRRPMHLLAWWLPHLASLVWLFLAIDWLQRSSGDGILRGLLLSAAAVLLRSSEFTWLTKANLVLCCLTCYSAGSAASAWPWSGWVATSLAAGAVAGVILVLPATSTWRSSLVARLGRFQRPALGLWNVSKGVLLVAGLLLMLLRLGRFLEERQFHGAATELQPMPTPAPSSVEAPPADDVLEATSGTLGWEQYRQACCYQSPWTAASVLHTQTACAALHGVRVQWEGIVRQVSIERRHNWAEAVLHWLPPAWSRWLRCRLGDKWPECDAEGGQPLPSAAHLKRCRIFARINQDRGQHCHLERFSQFTFRIEVEPNTSRFWECKSPVELVAESRFQATAFRLVPGDVVRFQGTLSAPTLGGVKPEVDLVAVECVSCEQSVPAYPPASPAADAAPSDGQNAVAGLALHLFQGAADFLLPHFIRLNVTQLVRP